ncbi:MAG: hypothetical protein MZU97_26840 [Bacillus subtilis]|nr:hypothetical protein [Bacillus subtilis]
MPVYDFDKRILEAGIYEVVLAKDKSQLFLVQSNDIKGRFPVSQALNMDKAYSLQSAKS